MPAALLFLVAIDPILFQLADNKDMHIVDVQSEFKFLPD